MQFRIDPPDASLHDTLTARLGSLPRGRITALTIQLGLTQRTLQPVIRRPMIAVFAGDHGAIAAGASSLPQKLTWQGVERLLAGGALLNAACREMALALSVIDAGVGHDFGSRRGLVGAKIEHGTANYALEPAMWRSQLERALETGRRLAHEFAAQDGNVLGLGSLGVGAEASAALVAHCMTGIDAELLTACAPDADADAQARRRTLLARALSRAGHTDDPLDALKEFGGFELVMMVGTLLGAAEKRVTVILDGFVATVALITACRIAPEVMPYCVLATRGTCEGEWLLADALHTVPLLERDLAPGEGLGAALCVPLLRTAAACLREQAGVAPAGQGNSRR